MLLAAYCCEGHQIVAHAIAHGAVPVHATGFDTLLYFAVQELIRSLMPSPTKRFILRPHDDGVVLYCLSHGNQHCVVAAPREPERAFAAFGFLADLHARGGRCGSASSDASSSSDRRRELLPGNALTVHLTRGGILCEACWDTQRRWEDDARRDYAENVEPEIRAARGDSPPLT